MHADPVIPVLLGLVLLVAAAKIASVVATRLNQPAVLGEIIAGVLLGNVALLGLPSLDFIAHGEIFAVLAGLGSILLLFEVGLDSSVEGLRKVGVSAALVALVGVIAPIVLGYLAGAWLLPDESHYVHLFIGATLCATSVGITARVLLDLGHGASPEAQIILGAAVIDDVLGLVVLAVVQGLITAADLAVAGGGDAAASGVPYATIFWISLKALGFLGAAIVIGGRIAPHVFKWGARLRTDGILLALSLIVCFGMAYLASLAGIAPIIGAFAAGLIIDGTGFPKYFDGKGKSPVKIEELILPLSTFLVPVFFVVMGMRVDLRELGSGSVLLTALVLSVAAVVSKQVCGLAVTERGVNRLAIGIGMIPRGEVGLIFASIGAALAIGGQRVISPALYSAIVVMVMVTTMVTPVGLKWAMGRKTKGKARS